MMKGRKDRTVPVKDKPASKPVNSARTKETPVKDASANNRPTKGRPVKDRPTEEGAVKDRPTKEGSLKDRPTKDKPDKGIERNIPKRRAVKAAKKQDNSIELHDNPTVHSPMLSTNHAKKNSQGKPPSRMSNEKKKFSKEDKPMLPKTQYSNGNNNDVAGGTKKARNEKEADDIEKHCCRKPNKRVLLICIIILVVILVISALIVVLVWKFVLDVPENVDMHEESMIRIDIVIHLNRSYNVDYANESSRAYTTLGNIYISELNRVFVDSKLSAIYLLTIVNQFRPGSVVVSSSSFFSMAVGISGDEPYLHALRSDVEEQLPLDLIENSMLGPLADVENPITVKQPLVVYTTPSVSDVQRKTSAEQKEEKQKDPYFEDVVCGTRPGLRKRGKRIVGGSASPFGSMPWIGSVRKVTEGHYCAATLLNERWAVTAAHCLGNTDHVVFGDPFLDWPSDFHEDVNISSVFPHPDYDYTADRADKPNDMALIRLNRPVKISSAVRPACIARSSTEIKDYRHCTAAGWGVSDYRGANTNRLQEVLLPLVPMKDCRTFYDDRDATPTYHQDTDDASSVLSSRYDVEEGVDADTSESVPYNESLVSGSMICAGGYPEGGVGACLADSGGPLICLGNDDLWYLVGVTSWSWGCDLPNIPNVFGRISAFQGFIDDTITKTEECINSDMGQSCFEGCVGGEDCLKQCQSGDFQCRAGYCIAGDKACNDEVECIDGSDEDEYANCLDDCGESTIIVHHESTSTLQSPGFPIAYPNLFRCRWQITASSGGRLLLNFTDFELENEYDFLDIGTGVLREDYLFSLTGSNPPLDILSPASTLVLSLSTDASTAKQGFYVTIEEILGPSDLRTCENGVQVIPSDRDIFCDGVKNCFDESDENRNCSMQQRNDKYTCGKDTILVSQESSANLSYIDYANSAHCRWVVNADLPSSRLRVHFLRFDLESNYDELFISSSFHSDATSLTYTGHKLPPDIVSPGPSLVITLKTDDSGVDLGFLLQVSLLDPNHKSTQEIITCNNGMEVIADEHLCNGYADCQDHSDEQPGCECGEPLLIIPPGGTINVTSYNYPQKYHRNIHCQWTLRTKTTGKITIGFSDFSLEEHYDFLYIGTSQQPKMLTLTGSSLPLYLVLPGEEIVVVFKTDHSISDRGFSMVLSDIGEIPDTLNFCENGFEVLPAERKDTGKCHN